MNYTIGDGMGALALAGTIVGCFYVSRQSRLRRLEILHKERMTAMEKGIPLVEFPLEPQESRQSDYSVLPILGTVLSTLSVGAMVVLHFVYLESQAHRLWITPLPFAFLGVGLIGFHFLNGRPRH